MNGKRSVYVPLLREPGENTIDVVDRIRDGIATEVPAMKTRGDIPEYLWSATSLFTFVRR